LVNLLQEKHDLNRDRIVDRLDTDRVIIDLERTEPGLTSDLIGNGAVDVKDLSLVLRYQTTTIPEAASGCECGH